MTGMSNGFEKIVILVIDYSFGKISQSNLYQMIKKFEPVIFFYKSGLYIIPIHLYIECIVNLISSCYLIK